VAARPTRKGIASRAHILHVAAEVFAARGYADTTFAELVRASGMTKGALYFHFESKQALALAVLQDKQRDWLDRVREEVAGAGTTAVQRLLGLADAMERLHRDDPGSWIAMRLTRDLAVEPTLAASLREQAQAWTSFVAYLVTQAAQESPPAVALDPTVLAEVLYGAMNGIKDMSEALDAPEQRQAQLARRLAAVRVLMSAYLQPRPS
jgi:AcrR family transcriptional regulator